MLAFIPIIIAACVYAQSINTTFVTAFSQALHGAGLNTFANVANQINSTTVGQNVLAQLSTGKNFSVFVPTDVAFQSLPPNITGNATLLADVIAYHVVAGNFLNSTAVSPNHTIGRTLLNDSSVVMLEGNKSQVVVFTTNSTNNKTMILNQPTNVTVLTTGSFQNIQINVIDHVLAFPGNLSTTAANTTNLTAPLVLFNQTTVPFLNSTTNQTTNTSLLQIWESVRGFTLFSPNNQALINASSALLGITGNQTAIGSVLMNHFVNGITVYSPSLVENFTLVSAGGENLTFTANSSGTFVTSDSVTAKIVQSDVLVSNGVIHVIDTLLFNEQTNSTAASSALQSATSAAGTVMSSTETGPVGLPTSTSASSTTTATTTSM